MSVGVPGSTPGAPAARRGTTDSEVSRYEPRRLGAPPRSRNPGRIPGRPQRGAACLIRRAARETTPARSVTVFVGVPAQHPGHPPHGAARPTRRASAKGRSLWDATALAGARPHPGAPAARRGVPDSERCLEDHADSERHRARGCARTSSPEHPPHGAA